MDYPNIIVSNQMKELISIKGLINAVTYHNFDFSWHEPLYSIKTKAWSIINIMNNLKIQLDRKSPCIKASINRKFIKVSKKAAKIRN